MYCRTTQNALQFNHICTLWRHKKSHWHTLDSGIFATRIPIELYTGIAENTLQQQLNCINQKKKKIDDVYLYCICIV